VWTSAGATAGIDLLWITDHLGISPSEYSHRFASQASAALE
jgi:transcriptional regulator GlxA family with amidase domain